VRRDLSVLFRYIRFSDVKKGFAMMHLFTQRIMRNPVIRARNFAAKGRAFQVVQRGKVILLDGQPMKIREATRGKKGKGGAVFATTMAHW
jgi:hypothetical protein